MSVIIKGGSNSNLANVTAALALSVDGSGVSQPVTSATAINLKDYPQTDALNGFYPDPGLYDTLATAGFDTDTFGALVTRGAVLTDEGSLRDDFSGTALATTIGANITTSAGSPVVTAAANEFGNGNGTGVKTGQYIKLSADPEADWTMVSGLNSATNLDLVANYPGTAGTGAGQVSNWATTTGTGGSFAVASSILTIASGTTNNALTGIIGVQPDFLPLLMQMYVSVSQRIANQTIVFGFQDIQGTTPNKSCIVSLSGTSNTAGNFTTQSSSAATDTQTTAFTYPLGGNSGTYHVYSISLSANQASLLIDGVVVATNTTHIPGPYDVMQVVSYISNGISPASTTSLLIDYIYYIDSDRIQIDGDFIAEPLSVAPAISAIASPAFTQGAPTNMFLDVNGNLRVSNPSALDSFGDLITCVRNAQWQQDFSYGANVALSTSIGSGGSITYSNGMVVVATGAAGAQSGSLISTWGLNYKVSHEWYFYFTAAMTSGGAAGSHQRIGAVQQTVVGTPVNGVCMGYEGTVFGLSYFKASAGQGSFVANTSPSIPRSSFNGDQCTGAAGSKYTLNGGPVALNLSNLNLYRLRGGWLGAASVVLEVISPDGYWVTMHTIVNPNQTTSPWTYSTSWNFLSEALNTTNTSNISISTGGATFGTTESVVNDFTEQTMNISAADSASTTATWFDGQTAVTGTPTANSAAPFAVTGYTTMRVQMSGSLIGTVIFECSTDGGLTWIPKSLKMDGVAFYGSTITSATTPGMNFEGHASVVGATHFRTRCTAYTSGTGTVLCRSTLNLENVTIVNNPVTPQTLSNFSVTPVFINSTASAVLKASRGNLYGCNLLNLYTATTTTQPGNVLFIHFFNTNTTTGLATTSWIGALAIPSPTIAAAGASSLSIPPGAFALMNFSVGITVVVNSTSTSNTTAGGTGVAGTIWIQ